MEQISNNDLKYKTGGKRLWAAIVDSIVFMPFLLVEQWITNNIDSYFIITVWTICITFLSLSYSIIAHYKYGQTIGKWVAGIKVIDISETRKISLRQALLRDSFNLGIEIIGLAYLLFMILQVDDVSNLITDYREFANQPIFWWTTLELISMFTNSKKRAIHDFLAKSVVVRI